MLEQDNKELALIAQNELDTNTQVEDLWRKALALANDDRGKAVKRYIKLRIRQLQKEVPIKEEEKKEPISEEKKPRKNVETKVNENNNESEKGIGILLVILAIIFIAGFILNESVKKSRTVPISQKIERAHLPNQKQVKTLKDYVKSCNQGIKSGCKKEAKVYAEACSYNDALRCRNLGYMYENGKGVEKSYIEALKYYDKSCKLGNKGGCKNIKILNRKIKHLQKNINKTKPRKVNYSSRKNSNVSNTLAAQTYQKKNNIKKNTIKKYALTIETFPKDARVQIMNIKPRYYDGIRLVKGKYKIRVSKKGYERQEGIVDPSTNEIYKVVLVRKEISTVKKHTNAEKKMNKKQRANFKSCIDGRYPALCKHSWLTSSQAKQVKKAERKANFKSCIDGRYPALCKHSWLTSSQAKQVKKAERKANFKSCIDGRYPALCKHSWLTSSQAKQVKKAERRAKLNRGY